MSYYSANGKNMVKDNNAYKMLELIINNDGATKYECLTKALGKVGSKQQLRGYYSCYFRGLVDSGVLTHDPKTFKYHITPHGSQLYIIANLKDAIWS
jgi:hypothetical protein